MSHKETSPEYRGVVAQISPTVRVIDCAQNIQWIVQTKSGGWKSESFFTLRDAMIGRLEPLDPEVRTILEALPAHHPYTPSWRKTP